MFEELLLSNSKAGVPLLPSAKVFKVTVGLDGVNLSVFQSPIFGSIQPSTFKGFSITDMFPVDIFK